MSTLDQYDNPLAQHMKSLRAYNSYTPRPKKYSTTGLDRNKYCSVQEVADRWSVHPQTIYKLVHEGHLETFRLSRTFRIKVASVLAFEVTGGA